ncbi:MAG: hypothetical protein HY042_08610, partial [Spirochaetia bacterium]|nr:hypothetical protein [Spirochaetia bacterium]
SQATLRDAAFVANVDAKPWEALTIGGTYYAGRSGQGGVKAVTVEDRAVVTLPGAFSTEQSAADAQTYLDTHQRKAHVLVQIMEAHALFRQGPWEARALAARGWMSEADTKAVNRATGENVGRVAQGGYLEVAYNVLSLTKSEQRLLVFLRNERLNTQKETVQRYAGSQDDFLDAGCTRTGNCKTTDMLAQGNRDLGYIPASDPGKELYGVKGTADRTNDRNIWTLGLAYYPHPNIVLKFEYQRNNSMSNYPRDQEYLNPDNHKIDQINFGMGLIL